jgi:septal ring factor EnvC (AmiA/AmiB activator)
MEQMRQALQATVDERAATVAQMTEQMAARDVEIGELTALRDQLTMRMKELEESNAALQEKVEVKASTCIHRATHPQNCSHHPYLTQACTRGRPAAMTADASSPACACVARGWLGVVM